MKPKLLLIVSLMLTLTACNLPGAPAEASGAGPRAWVDAPVEGSRFPLGESINIRWHASAVGGVQQVEVRINGQTLGIAQDFDHTAQLVTQEYQWTPPAAGEYLIQAIATGMNGGVSLPAENRIIVGDVAPTPIILTLPTTVPGLPTATLPFTPSPTSLPGALVQFWADPPTITAGACTTIRWHVENASRVVFGGIDQPFDGSYEACLCTDQRYTLTVTHLDGSEEKLSANVDVSGSCASPTAPPPSDTQGPPAPGIIMPSGNPTLACPVSNVKLVWSAPSDPSGIANYRVQLQVKTTGWNDKKIWDPVTTTQVNASSEVTCGGVYRWRVLARDGASNAGQNSEWAYFGIALP